MSRKQIQEMVAKAIYLGDISLIENNQKAVELFADYLREDIAKDPSNRKKIDKQVMDVLKSHNIFV